MIFLKLAKIFFKQKISIIIIRICNFRQTALVWVRS